VPGEQAQRTPYLLCRSQSRLCALPLHHVRETMRALPRDQLPDMPPFLLGVSVIRGQPVPVLDLARLTGADGAAPGTRYVTLDLAGRQVALAVDEVIGVRDLAPEALEGVPPLLDAGMLSALATRDCALLLVLQTTRLIPDALWPLLAAEGAPA
jgi:purine-binding chemotaxis protein CheW